MKTVQLYKLIHTYFFSMKRTEIFFCYIVMTMITKNQPLSDTLNNGQLPFIY